MNKLWLALFALVCFVACVVVAQEDMEEMSDSLESTSSAISIGQTVCFPAGSNYRSSPCGNVVGTSGDARGTVVATQFVSCSVGSFNWVQLDVAGAGRVWVADRGQFSSCGSGSGCRINRNSPLYKQCGQVWSNDRLGSSSTICAVGCLMSSVSSGLAGLGRTISGQTSNPRTLNNYLLSHGGYSGNLFVWGAVSPFGLTYEGQTSDQASIRNAICAQKVVVLNVNNGGHWVLATGYDGSTYYVNDSGFSRTSYSSGEVVRAGIYRV